MSNKRAMALIGAVLALACGTAWGNPEPWQLNMTEGVTAMSKDVYDLHMLILWICVAIGVLVFGAMIVAMVKFRKSKGAVAAKWSHNTTAEVIWTVVPILILIGMAVPATDVLMRMADTTEAELTVKVTGYQWKWRYEYLDYQGKPQDVNFMSSLSRDADAARQVNSGIDVTTIENYLLDVDRRLVLPTGTKIRFVLTADDVIHSWWVPVLGWKQDAIPGFINEAWTNVPAGKEGVYRGQCAELCGKDHGFMPVVVEFKPKAEFEAWLAGQGQAQVAEAADAQREWSRDELMAKGEAVYGQQCAACHQADGKGLAPAFPAIAGSPVATGPLDGHLEVVLNGRPNTAMQAFGRMLGDVEIAAALTYTRNAFGNATGDVVQPKQVAAARGATLVQN